MADIIATGTSGYATGSIDTATTLVNNVSPTDANHPNGCAAAAIQIEQILGSGTTLKGAAADLGARLAVGMSSDGKLNLSTDSSINGPLAVVSGGTGLATLTAQKVLIGDGTNDVFLGSGLIYQGPTSTSAGSTAAHEGTVTISSNQNPYSGVHFFTDFTLNNGVTLTLDDASHSLIIVATGTITINGTIDGIGAGSTAGIGSAGNAGTAGGAGFAQPAGGGGAGVDRAGAAGGSIFTHSVLNHAGGIGGVVANGAAGATAQVAGTDYAASSPLSIMGGAGGGGGGGDNVNVTAGGNGGKGGGSIVLVAPAVVLGSTAVLNTSGAAGSNGSGSGAGNGGGGGGGAGNVYVFCRSFTDSGATFTLSGGAAGAGGAGGGTGTAGAAGVKQILIYA